MQCYQALLPCIVTISVTTVYVLSSHDLSYHLCYHLWYHLSVACHLSVTTLFCHLSVTISATTLLPSLCCRLLLPLSVTFLCCHLCYHLCCRLLLPLSVTFLCYHLSVTFLLPSLLPSLCYHPSHAGLTTGNLSYNQTTYNDCFFHFIAKALVV